MPVVTRRPIDIQDLFTKRSRLLEIAWGEGEDEKFVVGYRPDAYTMEVHARLQLMGADDGLDAMADLMVTLLSEWDLTNGGQPFPINKDTLMALGLPLLGAISEAVQSDFSLGKSRVTANGTG